MKDDLRSQVLTAEAEAEAEAWRQYYLRHPVDLSALPMWIVDFLSRSQMKKTPYQEGREAYQNGISFWDNPYFDTANEPAPNPCQGWSGGWGDAQKDASAKKLGFELK